MTSDLLTEENWKTAVAEAYEQVHPNIREEIGYETPKIYPEFPEDSSGCFHFKLLLKEPHEYAKAVETKGKFEAWKESFRVLTATMMNAPVYRSEEEQRRFIESGDISLDMEKPSTPTIWVVLGGQGRNFLCGKSTVRSLQFYILSQIFSMLSDAN